MDRLIIVGAGGFGKVVLEHTIKNYDCVFVDDGIDIGTNIYGCAVIGRTADLKGLYNSYKNLIVAIGNNKVRENIYRIAAEIGYKFPNIICDSAYISPFCKIGVGCIILNHAVVQNNAAIGNGFILNPGVEIHHESVVENNVLIYTNSVIRTGAHIGSRAWIGSTLTIGNGVNIPADEIVSDGKTILLN